MFNFTYNYADRPPFPSPFRIGQTVSRRGKCETLQIVGVSWNRVWERWVYTVVGNNFAIAGVPAAELVACAMTAGA